MVACEKCGALVGYGIRYFKISISPSDYIGGGSDSFYCEECIEKLKKWMSEANDQRPR